MPSRREREKQERSKTKPREDKSCQAKHPIYGLTCWMSKPCREGRHMVLRVKPGGGTEKLYWPVVIER